MEPASTNLELVGEGADAMPVNLRHLDACRAEATDFLQKVNAAAERIRAQKGGYSDTSIAGTREAAAVISSSIEMTRVIADLRRLR